MIVDDGISPQPAGEPDDVSVSDTADISDTPDSADEMTLARELVLRAHPEAVQELITGSSLAELLASVPAAEAAFARVVAAARGATAREATATVPGGGAVRSIGVNVEGLGPLAKIRAGLNQS